MRYLPVALVASALGAFAGCGGRPAAEPQAAAPLTTGQQCLEDARAERSPAPQGSAQIHVAHILVRHAELKDPRGATRSPEAACLRALEALSALKQGGDWDAVAGQFSDSSSSDLGLVKPDELEAPFAAAAFELEVNQLSYVVESARGFHVILRKP